MLPRCSVLIILMLALSQKLDAQLYLTTFNDLGKTNVSGGLYVKTAVSAQYRLGKTSLGYGSLFNLKNHTSNFFSGAKLNLSRAAEIKGRIYEATAFFMYNPFSGLILETNWGLALNTSAKHFSYILGTNFRTTHLTVRETEDYETFRNKRLREKWNLMYHVGYNLRPEESIWNTGISLTNVDCFLINQDTNPMLSFNARYRLPVPLILYIETWYKPAGVFNISADSFGFFFRTGLRWELL